MITPPSEEQIREFQSGPQYARMEAVKYLQGEYERLNDVLKTATDHDHLMRAQGAAQVVKVMIDALGKPLQTG